MATTKEMDSIYYSCYTSLMRLLKGAMRDSHESYDVLYALGSEYRDWIIGVSGKADYPRVPSK